MPKPAEGHGETTAAEGHGEAKAEDAGHGGEGEHHYAFTGAPGEGALYIGPDNTVLDDAHDVPKWVKVSPFVAMLGRLIMALWFYIWNPSLPARLAENQRPLYLFLKNKWYFDEIYDLLFVKPAKGIGRFLWKRGDGDVIDGGLNGVAMGIVPFFTRLAGRAQSGYIFTYAFAMVLGIAVLITWMTISGGAQLMDNLLSIVTFLPAVAALILAVFLRGDDEAAQRNAKWVALFATVATFSVSLFILFRFRPRRHRLPVRGRRPWLLGLQYKMGVDGISGAVRDADHLHDAADHRGLAGT